MYHLGVEFIDRTHYAPYREKRSATLSAQLRKHGVEFRNPLNEMPLIVAARGGRPDLIQELLAAGADPDLRDNAGRTALRGALKAFQGKKPMKPATFSEIYRQLARDPIKTKVGNRMVKLDPKSMEWFLLNCCLVEYRQRITGTQNRSTFSAPELEHLLGKFPDTVLPPHRKKRAYLSAMLSKNEVHGTNPYNRRLFLRVGHGHYIPNPALDIGDRDEWRPVAHIMGLPELFASMGEIGAFVSQWWDDLRRREEAKIAKADTRAAQQT